MKKELPKYFVIKRDDANPLWDKYIEWLNKKYYQNWEGGAERFYGYDGNKYNNGTNCYDSISSFNNNPTELTLEEWDEIVNGEKENNYKETFIPGEYKNKYKKYKLLVDLGNIGKDGIFNLDGKYLGDYLGVTVDGEINDVIAKIINKADLLPEIFEGIEEETIVPPLTDEEIVKIRKLIG